MTQQLTLSGEETDDEYQRPSTWLYCPTCDTHVLRSERFDHAHEDDLLELDEIGDDENEDEPAERAGGVYEIELSYSADFYFRIPAWSEHEAKERAEDLVDYPNNCGDMYLVHSRKREVEELFTDDHRIDDEWDLYGGTPLWEVFGKDDE